jgi:hypothetical protein
MSKGKTSKYLKYAIGEIILVVIGILIALQVNSWNEERKAKIKSVEYHTRLIEDLDRAIGTSENINETAHNVLTALKHTIDLLISKQTPSAEDIEKMDYALIWVSRFNFQFSELSTFDEMKSNGEMSLIYNLETRNSLVNFKEYVVSVDAIFNRLGASIVNSHTFNRHILSRVDPETLDITNHYNFMELANDKEFINELSKFSVHWRGNAWFTKQIERKAKILKDSLVKDLNALQ